MTRRLAVQVVWLAGADQVAHAETPKGYRTLCGLERTPERFAWPPTEGRCHACREKLAELERVPA